MPNSTTDRSLLFGILARQMDFISRDALTAAMNVWVLEKKQPLGQILLEQKAFTAETRSLLEAVVQRHLALHGNDVEKSLAAASTVGAVGEEFQRSTDASLNSSLANVTKTLPTTDVGATVGYAPAAAPISVPHKAGRKWFRHPSAAREGRPGPGLCRA